MKLGNSCRETRRTRWSQGIAAQNYRTLAALGAVLAIIVGSGCASGRGGTAGHTEPYRYNILTEYPAVGGPPLHL